MTKLVWDTVGARTFESGLDRGVLYLPSGVGVAWSGLTSVETSTEANHTPVYYDGRRVANVATVGEFKGSLSAVTYPDEFDELSGFEELRGGAYVGQQKTKRFGLCYRTYVTNDLGKEDYKIHVLFNLMATPSDRSHQTLTDSPEIIEFNWELSATQSEVPGMAPTSELVFDSRKMDPWLLEDLEKMFYGDGPNDAVLMDMKDLVKFVADWYRVKIIDHGDGTWSATSDRPGFIFFMDVLQTSFEIRNAKTRYLDEHTFQISDTIDIMSEDTVIFTNNGDGTWTARSENEAAIILDDEGMFEIHDVDLVYTSPSMWRVNAQTD